MTVRVIVDANSRISIRLILLQLNAHVQKITWLSTAICSVLIILPQKPYSSFIFKDILTKLYQVIVNIVVHRNTSHFFKFKFIFAFI